MTNNKSSRELWHDAAQAMARSQVRRDAAAAAAAAALPALPDGIRVPDLLALGLVQREAGRPDDDVPNVPEGADGASPVALTAMGLINAPTLPNLCPPDPEPAPVDPALLAAATTAATAAVAAMTGQPAAGALPPDVVSILDSISQVLNGPAAAAGGGDGDEQASIQASDVATIRRLFRGLPEADRQAITAVIERENYGVANYLRDPSTIDHAAVLIGDALAQRLEDGRRLNPDLTPADLFRQIAGG